MNAEAPPSIAAIIVNYNAGAYIEAHMPALTAELAGAPIVVVDNASPNGDLALLRARAGAGDWRNVMALDAGANLGFAAGNDFGYEAIRDSVAPEFLLLINPDAKPEPGAIAEMLAVMRARPRAGVVGAQLVGEDGRLNSCRFHFPTAAREFAQESEIGVFQRWAKAEETKSAAPVKVDWVSGTAMLVRTAAIKGPLMDPGYFLYYEETDMMRRLTDEGWEIWSAPAARIVHIGGRSTGVRHDAIRGPRLPVYWFQSWRRYYAKHHGWPAMAVAGAAKLAGVAVSKAKCALKGVRNSKPERYMRDVFIECFLKALPPDARVTRPRRIEERRHERA